MDESFYKLIMEKSPTALAYHKIVLNEAGTPCDYIFLQVNHAFEKITGLRQDQIVGRKATEVIPGILKEDFDLIAAFGAVALQGKSAEYEHYSKSLEHWFKLQVFSLEPYYFAVNFTDISHEKLEMAEYDKLLELLNENELMFHHIIQNLPFSLSIITLDGKILFVNETGIKLFEINEDIDITSGLSSFPFWVNNEDRQQFVNTVMKSGMIKECELYLQTKNGKKFWAMASSMKIKYQGQYCTLSTLHDISDRKKMEDALKGSEEKFRLIFENAGEIILIAQNNRIQICNSMTQKMTGYSIEELTQMPFIDFVHPEDRPLAAKVYHDRLAGKNTLDRPHYRVVRKDGGIVWIEANGVLINWNGQPALQYFIIDITEQKKAEDALKASEEKYRLITEFASDMIWVFNYTNYKFTYVSPSIFHLLGYHPDEALALSLNELIPEEFLRQLAVLNRMHIKEMLDNPSLSLPYITEMQNTHKNGQRIWIESSSRYHYNDKKEIEIVGVSRNIEERKHSEQKVLYLSYHDQLTGLYNRRFYEEELQRLDTVHNFPITLILADVNGLKLTNDAFGHLAGDQLLIRTASILRQECKSDDIIARIGGDEFILLLPQTGQSDAQSLIGRIKKVMESKSCNNTLLSVSFGHATKTAPEQTMENIFIEAENAMYRHKLNESNSMRNEIIKVITKAFYGKSKLEEAHDKRVGKLSGEIARAMCMNEEAVSEIITAGSLHDIGKINMDEKLFNKQEPFTEQEWEEYKRHPEKGYQILKASNEFAQIAQYVLCHHERMDGSGYPRGILGEDIPIQSRILSIADAYDSMTNLRGHCTIMDQEAAIEEIKKNAGTQFDADIAKIFVEKILKHPWI